MATETEYLVGAREWVARVYEFVADTDSARREHLKSRNCGSDEWYEECRPGWEEVLERDVHAGQSIVSECYALLLPALNIVSPSAVQAFESVSASLKRVLNAIRGWSDHDCAGGEDCSDSVDGHVDHVDYREWRCIEDCRHASAVIAALLIGHPVGQSTIKGHGDEFHQEPAADPEGSHPERADLKKPGRKPHSWRARILAEYDRRKTNNETHLLKSITAEHLIRWAKEDEQLPLGEGESEPRPRTVEDWLTRHDRLLAQESSAELPG